jgi:hypothetical protein
MKKMTIFLLLAIALVACTKEQLNKADDPQVSTEQFFSRVRHYKDNRQPSTDTVWTLRLFNQTMVDSFTHYNGYVYNETSVVKEVGVIWSR